MIRRFEASLIKSLRSFRGGWWWGSCWEDDVSPSQLPSRHHAEPTEAAHLLHLRTPRPLVRPHGRGGHRTSVLARRDRAVPDRGRAGERHRTRAGQVPGRGELRAVPRTPGEAVRPRGPSVPVLILPGPAELRPCRPPCLCHLLVWCCDPLLLRGHRLLLLQRLRTTLRDAARPHGTLPVDLHLLCVQLSDNDPVCVGGEAPSSHGPDRQLQRGQLRVPDVQRALRPVLLALLPHLPPPRTQHPADPTGRNPVSLPGNQRVGAERRRGRPHVLRKAQCEERRQPESGHRHAVSQQDVLTEQTDSNNSV